MNHQFIEAREFIAKARAALRQGDRQSARQLGEQAALRAPNMEDVWLILAASDPNPQEALAYARKALQLTPQSARARQAVEWASDRLKQAQVRPAQPSQRASQGRVPPPPKIVPTPVGAVTSLPQKRAYQTAIALPQLKSNGPNWLLPALFAGTGFMLVGFIIFFALTSPALASIVDRINAPAAAPQEILWAPAEVAKPGVSPIQVSGFAIQPGATATSVSTEATSTSIPTEVAAASQIPAPTDAPTEVPAVTPAATETPGTMAMEVLADTPTSAYVAPTYSAPKDLIAKSGNGQHWIDVDLSQQMVYAYEGDTVVNSFLVSTGTSIHPTVTGKFAVYIKLRSGSMSGPGYFLPNVPYIMYFYKSYGLHGTYWHSNFGTPMSHGCVNLRTDDAAWLYNWSSIGTVVNVHY